MKNSLSVGDVESPGQDSGSLSSPSSKPPLVDVTLSDWCITNYVFLTFTAVKKSSSMLVRVTLVRVRLVRCAFASTSLCLLRCVRVSCVCTEVLSMLSCGAGREFLSKQK